MVAIARNRTLVLSAEREAAFSLAYRHSRRVRWLRRSLPIIVVAVALLMVLWNVFNPASLLNIPASVEGLSLNGSKLSMEHPKMNGYTKDNRPYKVKAERAEQDLTAPTIVDLVQLSAELVLEGGTAATLTANQGQIDTKAGQIKLMDQVLVTTTRGESGKSEEALINTDDGSITVTKPITLASPTGEMRADRLTMTDRGKVMVLEDNVKGWFKPAPPEAPKGQ